MKGNRCYKDSVFTLLFKDKEKLIELYNAIEGTQYSKKTDVQINTLEKVLYMDRENDISFLLDGKLIILVEHQSTINENMPLRLLLYIARVYEKLIDSKAIYKEQQIKIPTPEFIVLYNGADDYPKEMVLHLSDAFIEQRENPELNLTVKVININYEKSSEVLEKSKTLKDYSYFIYQVKRYRRQKYTLEEAIEKAIKDCVRQGMLERFLEENSSEVINMLYTEFNLEEAKKVWQEEAEKRGEERGEKRGEKNARIEMAVSLMDVLDIETIAKKTKLSVEEIKELKNQ